MVRIIVHVYLASHSSLPTSDTGVVLLYEYVLLLLVSFGFKRTCTFEQVFGDIGEICLFF